MSEKRPGLLSRLAVALRATVIPGAPLRTIDSEAGVLFGLVPEHAARTRITPERALSIGAVLRGIDLLATDCAKLPRDVLVDTGEGWERDRDHPASYLVREDPGEGIPAFYLWKALTKDSIFRGNGLAYIVRDGTGRPTRLRYLAPERCSPSVVRGERFVFYDGEDGQTIPLPYADVFHLRGLSDDGWWGFDVFTLGKEAMGEAVAAREWVSRYFEAGGGKRVLLEHPKTMSEDAERRFVGSWRRLYDGVENAHKTAILQEGMTAKEIGTSLKEADTAALRDLNLRLEIANLIGISPSKLGDPSRTSYASLEQERQDYLDESLDGRLVGWEAEANAKLLTPEERAGRYRFEINRNALVRVDYSTRTEGYAKATGKPWLTVNEVRRMEGMPPIEGGDALGPAPNESAPPAPPGASEPEEPDDEPEDAGEGDEEPTPEGKASAPPPSPPGLEETRSLADAILEDAVRRMRKRLAFHVTRAAGRPDSFDDWLEELAPKHRDHVLGVLAHPWRLRAAAYGLEAEPVEAYVDELFDEARAIADRVAETTTRPRFAEAMEKAFEAWETER